MRRSVLAAFIALLFVAAPKIQAQPAQLVRPANDAAADRDLAGRVERLVRELNDERAATRDTAEAQLLELAGKTAVECDRLLKLMPEPKEDMPLALRDRLARIRNQIEDKAAKSAVAPTRLSLPPDELPLAAVFNLIEQQTGNKLLDRQGQIGVGGPDAVTSVTLGLDNELFWPALDMLLDEAKLSVYNFGGDNGLAIVARPPDEGPRFGRAAYSGPFRMEVLEVQGQRNGREPKRKALKLQLEVAWEPRLRPIAITQPAAEIKATDDAGNQIAVIEPEAVFDVEPPIGTQAGEIILSLELPPRDVKQITVLHGKFKALVPGRQVKFKFGDLANTKGKVQRQGGVQVTVDEVKKNNAVWEVHMQFQLDEANHVLESHRTWVFQNLSYLTLNADATGETRVEQAGYETTKQTPNEVGVAYIFDLPEGKGIGDYTWIYETPAAIIEIPVEFEVKDIDLP